MNAADFRALMERWAVVMADHRDWLIQLDSVVGDSDLGLTMSDGFRSTRHPPSISERRRILPERRWRVRFLPRWEL